jgi:hypothetical protein
LLPSSHTVPDPPTDLAIRPKRTYAPFWGVEGHSGQGGLPPKSNLVAQLSSCIAALPCHYLRPLPPSEGQASAIARMRQGHGVWNAIRRRRRRALFGPPLGALRVAITGRSLMSGVRFFRGVGGRAGEDFMGRGVTSTNICPMFLEMC